MNQDAVLERLAAAGGYYQNDHIVLTSGRHSDTYANFRVFFEANQKEELRQLCRALAERFYDLPEVDYLIGPKRGGAIIAELMAELLSAKFRKTVRPIVAFKHETAEKAFTFYDDDLAFLRSGRVGVFTDDVLATGSSFRPIQQRVEETGSSLLAAAYMLNRSGLRAHDLGIARIESLADIVAKTSTAEECAANWLCGLGQKINTTVGHGAEYVAKHGQPGG